VIERARAALSMSVCCRWMLWARRSAKFSMPAPTVLLFIRSMKMKLPVSRFSA
jgi:hypothetical protein